MSIGTGSAVGDEGLLGETYAPTTTTTIQPTSSLEVAVAGDGLLVDSTTLTASNITLVDISSGYAVPFTASRVINSPDNSRIVILPSEDLEHGHRIELTIKKEVLFDDGSAVGPLVQNWTVAGRGDPFLFFDANWRTLITDRCAGGGALDPWQRAYTYVVGQAPQRSWLETSDVGATDGLTRTTNNYVGIPGSHELALQAWDQGAAGGDDYGLHKELSCLQALAWSWAISGTTSYRDRLQYFLEAWVDNFGPVDQRYTGFPEDSIFWSQTVVKMCIALDFGWSDTDAIDGPLRKRTASWLVEQAGYLANEWAQTSQSNLSASYLDQWINLAVFTVGRLTGDRRMRLWAYDGSTKPTGWSDNERPFTNLWLGSGTGATPLFNSAGRYVLEDEQEAKGTGVGFTEAIQAAWGTALFLLQRTLDGEHDWDTTNSNGDTIEDVYNLYANYLDGTTDWDTVYPGHYLEDFTKWRAAVTFGLPAAIYKTAVLRNIVDDTWGSRTGPKAEDPVWWMGGDAAYWPAAGAVGVDTTDPPDVTGASSPNQGATWIEYTWTHSANTDERDIVRYYRIYDGAVLVGTTRHNSFVYNTLAPSTNSTVSIRSVDIAGNEATGVSVGPTSTTAV